MAKKSNSSDFIDFKSIFRAFRKRWWWFIISLCIFGLLGYVYAMKHNPEYSVKANVMIADDNGNPLLRSVDLDGLFGSSARVDDEVYVISSHTVLKEAVKKLGINVNHVVKDGLLKSRLAYPDFPVTVTAPDSMADTLRSTLVFKIHVSEDMKADATVKVKRDKVAEIEDVALPAKINTPYGEFTVVATDHYPKGEAVKTVVTYSGYDDVAESLSEDLDFDMPSRKTNVIEMEMETENTDYGMALLNEIIKVYNERGLSESKLQGEHTIQFIDERIKLLAVDLEQTEMALQQYKERNKIIDVNVEATYQTERRGALDGKIVDAEAEAEMIRITLEFLKNSKNDNALVPVIGNDAMVAAITAYNDLILQRITLQSGAKQDNAALRRLDEQITAMHANLLTSVQRTYENARVVVNDLKKEMASTAGRLGEVPTQAREYLTLLRQQQVKQQLYMFLLQRREETAMMVANSKPKAVIVDEAYTINEPVTMGRKMLFAIFLLLGLIVPVIVIYILQMTRNKFDTRDEVERIVDIPMLGEIATTKSGDALVVGSNGSSSASELFRLLRSNLLFILNESRDKVVLMTSTNPGEGKSYISINLAMSLSMLGKRVLLLGMDIRKPKLAEYLDLNVRYGVTQYLTNDQLTLDDLIVRDPKYGDLDVITAGPIPPNPSELLASKKVDEMFAQLRERYDYIVVDTAPVGMVSDTFTLDRVADATIYVCRANYTSKRDLQFANDIYEQHRLKKLAMVVNGSTMRKAYGYGEHKA